MDSTNPFECILFIVHGMSSGPAEMEDLAQHLAVKGYHYHLSCLRGHQRILDDEAGMLAELRHVKARQWVDDIEDEAREVLAGNPGKKLVLIGQSFGGLLCLLLAAKMPEQISKLILLAPPGDFRSRVNENLLRFLSYFPDAWIDRLGLVSKTPRESSVFWKPRKALSKHSIAAAVRLMQVRKMLAAKGEQVFHPILLLQDPDDHLLSSRSPEFFKSILPRAALTIKWLPGGQHELTLGHSYKQVYALIESFLTSNTST